MIIWQSDRIGVGFSELYGADWVQKGEKKKNNTRMAFEFG